MHIRVTGVDVKLTRGTGANAGKLVLSSPTGKDLRSIFTTHELKSQVPTPLPYPYTLHPTPHTPHSTPYTLHLTPYTLSPTSYTLHPALHTLHSAPYTPETSILTDHKLKTQNLVLVPANPHAAAAEEATGDNCAGTRGGGGGGGGGGDKGEQGGQRGV